MSRGQYPRRKDDVDDMPEERMDMLSAVKDFAHKDLQHIGLERAMKLEKMYGKDDLRVKKAKLECFFNAFAILGTVRYAAQVVGLNPRAVAKVIKSSDKYKARFETAYEEFSEYLEQVAIVRAVTKSDSLLQFLLRASNPRKFSERLRVQAITDQAEKDEPLTLVFGEYSQDWVEPNYLHTNDLVTQSDTDNDEGDDNSDDQ